MNIDLEPYDDFETVRARAALCEEEYVPQTVERSSKEYVEWVASVWKKNSKRITQ